MRSITILGASRNAVMRYSPFLLFIALATGARADLFTMAKLADCAGPVYGTSHAVLDNPPDVASCGHGGFTNWAGHAEAFATAESLRVIESQVFNGTAPGDFVEAEARFDFSVATTDSPTTRISFLVGGQGSGNTNGSLSPASPFDASLSLQSSQGTLVDHLTVPYGSLCETDCSVTLDEIVTFDVSGLPLHSTVKFTADLFAEGAVLQSGESFTAAATLVLNHQLQSCCRLPPWEAA